MPAAELIFGEFSNRASFVYGSNQTQWDRKASSASHQVLIPFPFASLSLTLSPSQGIS